ncbi:MULTISPECIES: hypothetical protein [unclassified Methanoregula]|uniref:hypothetical protein n=1 Tax=unclassified Methanoregula TaxID=2649730 RepID=UPI0025FBEF6E|nr:MULTISPECIES: hypothetical protein [unclassified Methanoregula]
MMMNLQLTKGFIYLMFYLETALPLVCIAIIFGALGAGIQYWICTRDGDSKDSPGSQVLHSRILLGVLPVVFILVLFLVFISPDIVVSGIRSGDIDWNPCCERMDFIDKIDRTGTDSISISMKADQDKYPELAPRPVFFISVNGKDLSNMSSIRAQGLADTIDPLEGLLFADQSSVILKGPDVSNSSGPCYVNISEKFSKRAVRPLANYRV